MATSNRGGNRGGNRGRAGKNNNPEGRNQYDRGWMDSARERPFTAAAAVGGAVAAGVFLWSRRNQISEQLAGLSDQLSDWRESFGVDGEAESSDEDSGEAFMARPARRTSRRSQSDIAEEALTLKATGKSGTRPTDPMVAEQAKAGALAE